jgi:hypothetical protein
LRVSMDVDDALALEINLLVRLFHIKGVQKNISILLTSQTFKQPDSGHDGVEHVSR